MRRAENSHQPTASTAPRQTHRRREQQHQQPLLHVAILHLRLADLSDARLGVLSILACLTAANSSVDRSCPADDFRFEHGRSLLVEKLITAADWARASTSF